MSPSRRIHCVRKYQLFCRAINIHIGITCRRSTATGSGFVYRTDNRESVASMRPRTHPTGQGATPPGGGQMSGGGRRCRPELGTPGARPRTPCRERTWRGRAAPPGRAAADGRFPRRPASESATRGSVIRSADPVSRNRPGRGSASTAVLIAGTSVVPLYRAAFEWYAIKPWPLT